MLMPSNGHRIVIAFLVNAAHICIENVHQFGKLEVASPKWCSVTLGASDTKCSHAQVHKLCLANFHPKSNIKSLINLGKTDLHPNFFSLSRMKWAWGAHFMETLSEINHEQKFQDDNHPRSLHVIEYKYYSYCAPKIKALMDDSLRLLECTHYLVHTKV
jgi:hypothetical protein